MHKGNRLNIWSIAVALIVWIVAVLAISFYTFFVSIDKHMEDHVSTTLCDVSRSIAQLLRTKIEGQWLTLATVAKYAGTEEDLLQSEALVQIMDNMEATSDFSDVFIADRKGNSVTNDGANVNIADRYYYKKAIQGYSIISQILQSRISGEDVLIFSRPVYGQAGISGALSAAIRVEDFQKLIDLSIFDGMGYTYIISGNGNVLIESASTHQPLNEKNVVDFISQEDAGSSLDVEDLKHDMRCRQHGFFTFVVNGDVHNVYYMPLGINDWYVFCGVPHGYLKAQSSELFWIALKLCLGIVIAFVPVFFAIWIMGRVQKAELLNRNRELQWNEERFNILSSLSNSIIFEVDLKSGTMIYLTGLHLRPDHGPVREGFPWSLVKAGYIHPDDGEAFIRMHKEIPPFTETLSGEFRIKGKEEEFVWHRIEEVLLSNEKGKAIRCIGRAEDIHDEKKAIELLEAKVQIDSGSGLYNKNATELFVRQCIEEEGNGVHAMIVMDIDEFKAVNDSRGHFYGDQVIVDLANLLKNQFRSTDILGRIGGDEFMLFLSNIPSEIFVAAKVAKIRNAMMSMHQVGLSVGIAIHPKDGTTYEELYKHADAAMYSVKKHGKNGFEFFEARSN